MPASGGQESFSRELWARQVWTGQVCARRTLEDMRAWTPRVQEGRAGLAGWRIRLIWGHFLHPAKHN